MKREKLHRAHMEHVAWEDVRAAVKRVNPDIATIIDELDPPKDKFALYKAEYPFGTKIAHKRKLYLPTEEGDVEEISSPNIPDSVKNNMVRRKMPTVMMLDNCSEAYFEMPDRIISAVVMRPGSFLWLWEQLDQDVADIIAWSWSLVSGARSLYSIPKISDSHEHKKLQKKYGIKSQIPRNWSEQWEIFVDLANSQNFTTEWHSTMLFFSDAWFDAASKDPAWKDFSDYLFNTAWQDSQYWRYKNTFEIAWETFIYEVIDRNIKPNLYLASLVKQLILTGIGVLPCLTVAEDDAVAPIKALQNVYLEDYVMRNYFPVFMQPHTFSFGDSMPSYYSLQYPNLLETIPMPRTLPSVLSAIPEIHFLLDSFKEKIAGDWVAENSPIDRFCKNVKCDYFHYRAEEWNDIFSTEKLPEEDSRLMPEKNDQRDRKFVSTSNLISGCVRFMNSNV